MIRTEEEYREAVRRLDALADAEGAKLASRGLPEDEAKRALDPIMRSLHPRLFEEVEGYERLMDIDDAEAFRQAARGRAAEGAGVTGRKP